MPSKKLKPIDATIAVTDFCNSRCRMCNIWQKTDKQELAPAALVNLSPSLRYVNISGGEPFLRNDLDEIIRIVKTTSSKAQIIISSNGLATEKIAAEMENILAIDSTIGVRISLDGGQEIHDRIRGIPGIYDRALATLEELKRIGIKNLGISLTIMPENVKELPRAYDLAEKLGVQFAIAMVQNSDIYFGMHDNSQADIGDIKSGLNYVISRELKSRNPKRWLRSFYDYGLLRYAETGERLLPSGAGFDSLFINARGDIYPSNLASLKLGNIKDGRLDDTWNSDQAESVRREIIEQNIQESWIICTIRGEMRRHPASVLKWVGINKAASIVA